MGYRDDFYTKDNIVGYTGDIANNPTVYFMTEKDGIKTYGRITLNYPKDKKNEGRELVRSRKDYTRKNLSVHKENVGGETKYTLKSGIKAHNIKNMSRKGDTTTITDNNDKIWVFEKHCVERVNGIIEHVSRGKINENLTENEKENLFKLVTECRPELKERKKMYKDKDETTELEFQDVDQNGDKIFNFDKKVNSNLEPPKIISTKKEQELEQLKTSGEEKMVPKTKSTPDKQVDKEILAVLSSDKTKEKDLQKPGSSKDPQLEKPIAQNNGLDLDALASPKFKEKKKELELLTSPKFRKKKKSKQNTRSTNPNKSGDNKTRQTRQRRRSSMGQ